MARSLFYTVRRIDGLYLNGIEANENYAKNACAPTMGVRHDFCEYKSVWGKKPKLIEPLTLVNYIHVILEEYRWEKRLPDEIAILPEKVRKEN